MTVSFIFLTFKSFYEMARFVYNQFINSKEICIQLINKKLEQCFETIKNSSYCKLFRPTVPFI